VEKEKNKVKAEQKGMMVIWISFFLNFVLFGIKIWAGNKTNSLALLADGWHTLSDCVSTVVVFIGLRWSMKPADKEHPFGHGRAETVAAIFVGFFLIMVAFEFGKEAVTRLTHHVQAHYGWIGIVVMIISVVVMLKVAALHTLTVSTNQCQPMAAHSQLFFFFRNTCITMTAREIWMVMAKTRSSAPIRVRYQGVDQKVATCCFTSSS